jgi:enoyl-CoA hydratase
VNDTLHVERHGSCATLTLNRPEKRNAITYDMWCRLPGILENLDQDADVKVVVIRGADEAAFSAGADISEFASLRSTEEGARRYNAATEAAEARLAELAKPSIAMVQGPCIGGGCGLAVACDLRFSDPTARFGITPANLGLVYSLPATKRLVDLVGPARAKYILFSGRHVTAERALEIGLVDELFEPHELAAATTGFAETVASRAQFSVRSTKRMVHLIMAGQTADNEETRGLRLDSFATDDYREGVRAFLEKRAPRFTYA